MFGMLLRFIKSKFAVIAFLALFLCILEFQNPRFFSWDDNATFFSSCYHYNYDSIIQKKTFPWIVWTQYAGQTNLSQSQSGVFYLPAYIATALSLKMCGSPLWNIEILVISHLLLGAWGMTCLLRAWKIPIETANASGLLYATTPFFIIVSKSWIFVAYSMAFTPWLFLLMDRFLEKPCLKIVSAYILLKSLFFTQGYTQTWINLSLIEALYFCVIILHRPQNRGASKSQLLIYYAAIQFAHLIVISPLLSINIQTVLDSAYRGGKINLSSLLIFRTDFLESFLAQICVFYSETYLLSSSSILFFGGTFLLFFYIYRKTRNNEKLPVHHLILLFFTVLTFLLSTSFYQYLALFPPFHILRWPIKFLMITPFFFTMALAYFSHPQNSNSFRFKSCLIFFSALAQMFLLLFPSNQIAFSKLRIHGIEDSYVKWPYSEGRILPISSDAIYVKQAKLLGYNFTNWNAIPALGGYDPLVSKLNASIALGIQITGALQPHLVETSFPHLKRWGVRYLTGSPLDPEIAILDRSPELRRIYSDNELVVWEYPEALPLISLENNPDQTINFQMNPDSIVFHPQTNSGNFTVRFAPLQHLFYRYKNDQGFSKWQPIQKNLDNTILLAIPSPAETVEMSYRPPKSLVIMMMLSCLLIVFLLLILVQPKQLLPTTRRWS